MQTKINYSFKGLSANQAPRSMLLLGLALGAAACSSESDHLRDDIPQTGVAAAVQINLPDDGQQAQIAATVYKDAVAQPLVGGDVLQARTDQSLVTLLSQSSLNGHYSGALFVDHPESTVDVAVNYDQEASAENRWFGSDDLLVNPGPGSLVGYAVTGMQFPPAIAFESPLPGQQYASKADVVTINWTPENVGHQVRLVATVSCYYASQSTTYSIARNLGIEGEDETAAGSYTMTVDDFVEVAPYAVTLANVSEYIAVYVSALVLGIDPDKLLEDVDPLQPPGEVDRCDMDVTLFREQDNVLPAAFSGGYAITSRSSTVRIVYAP